MSSAPSDNDHPLGLTVHSLPRPDQAAVLQGAKIRSGRWKMVLLFLVCAAPVVASYFTYYVIRPEGRRNFGALIDPQRPLPDIVAQGLDGTPVNLQALKGQWLLVSVGAGACGATCERHLYLQRQMREGLGKERDRLDWVWLINDAGQVSEGLQPALKDATVLRVDPDKLAQWLKPEDGLGLENHLYLVDPLGNWMMRFPPAVDIQNASKVKRDLDRLLRASSSWDKAGR